MKVTRLPGDATEGSADLLMSGLALDGTTVSTGGSSVGVGGSGVAVGVGEGSGLSPLSRGRGVFVGVGSGVGLGSTTSVGVAGSGVSVGGGRGVSVGGIGVAVVVKFKAGAALTEPLGNGNNSEIATNDKMHAVHQIKRLMDHSFPISFRSSSRIKQECSIPLWTQPDTPYRHKIY